MQIKNVAVGATLLWRDVATVGIHAFARHLYQRGCNVAWYSMPLSALHLLSVAGIYKAQYAESQRRRFDAWRAGPQIQEQNGARLATRVAMTVVHPSIGIPWLSSETVSRNYLKWRLPSLARRSAMDGIAPLDTVMFDAGGFELFFTLKKQCKLRIYRVNDLAGEYVPQVASRIETEKEVIRQSDLLFVVSHPLMEDVIKMRGSDRGVYYLPNGFDGSLFSEIQPLPPEYETIPAPRAVLLAGYLGSTYDWELILATARRNPEIALCIVGYGPTPDDLPANIHILGRKPHEQVPAYLQHAQVGLIPFLDIVRSRRVERPLKFYEYLAAGLPIVAVPYGGMTIMGEHATLADAPESYADAVAALATATPEQRQAQRAAADQFSWQARLAEFDTMLAGEGISYATAETR